MTSIYFRQVGAHIIVYGNTFPVKEQLKALGGRFLGEAKTWQVPNSIDALKTLTGLGAGLGTDAAASGVTETAAETDGTTLSVRQLVDRAASAVSSAFGAPIWVQGEVQNFSRRGAAIFFDLAEGKESTQNHGTIAVRAVIWGNAMAALTQRRTEKVVQEVLQEGLKIRCLGTVQVYKDRGQLTLVIDDIDPSHTKGALALAREALMRELRAKGLETTNKRLRITAFPLLVGLVSAPQSRAYTDFTHQLASLGYPGTIVFCPATMQGPGTPREVARAVERLAGQGVDLIVVTRGGGSAADLRWFDAPEIAYSIAHATVPVVAAIGHHDDVCVAEEICYQRQKTPTAAADFVIQCCLDTRRRLDTLAQLCARTLTQAMTTAVDRAALATERLAAHSRQRLYLSEQQVLNRRHDLTMASERWLQRVTERQVLSATQLARAAGDSLSARQMRLHEWEAVLKSKDPSPWLAAGWTRLLGQRGIIRRHSDTTPGDTVIARLANGRLHLTVTEINPDPAPETL